MSLESVPETQRKITLSWALFIVLLIGSNFLNATITHWGTLFWYKQITLEERMDKRHARTEERIHAIEDWIESIEEDEAIDEMDEALIKEELDDLMKER